LGHQIEQQKIYKINYTIAFGCPPINKTTHNNQPKTGSRNGGEFGGELRRAGRMQKARYHHFEEVKTKIKLLSLVNIFFLGRFILFNKTSNTTSTPSA
jgi:hypothetical protein